MVIGRLVVPSMNSPIEWTLSPVRQLLWLPQDESATIESLGKFGWSGHGCGL